MSSDPYRTKAEILPEPSFQEELLQDIMRNEKKMKQLESFKLWKDIKLGFGLLALLAVCFLVSFLFVSGMLNPLFSYGATMFLGLLGVSTAVAGAIIFATVISVFIYDFLRERWLIRPHRFKFKIPVLSSVRAFFLRVEYGEGTARTIKNLKKEIEEQKAWLENG